MKRFFWMLGVVAMLAGPAGAWRPAGWVYGDGRWLHASNSGDWFWLNTGEEQWVFGFAPADGWRQYPQSALASGWSYYDWPYVYCQANGAWYYLNEVDVQQVVNMTLLTWTRFGAGSVDSRMVSIPAAQSTGVDPDFGAYALWPTPYWMERYAVTHMQWEDTRAWALAHDYAFDNAGGGEGQESPRAFGELVRLREVVQCAQPVGGVRAGVLHRQRVHARVRQGANRHGVGVAVGRRLPAADGRRAGIRGAGGREEPAVSVGRHGHDPACAGELWQHHELSG